MASIVRQHNKAEASTNGTTLATTLAADVPAGNTIVAVVAGRAISNPFALTGLSKPAGETASWIKLQAAAGTMADGSYYGDVEVWALRTTVAWAAGQSIAATWNGTTYWRFVNLVELAGVTTTVVSAANNSVNNNNSASSLTVSTAATLNPGDVVLDAGISFLNWSSVTVGGTATGARTALAAPASGSAAYVASGASIITGPGSRSSTFNGYANQVKAVLIVALRAEDQPPNAPSLTTNANGETVDRATTLRLGWDFTSPNASDHQSAYDLQHRLLGDATWTTVSEETLNTWRDFPGGSLPAGQREWQARVYGALGKVSEWSPIGFAVLADRPGAPTITGVTDGQTVPTSTLDMGWSTPTQDAYQFRRLGDASGVADTNVIYEDSGTVNSATARSLTVTFTTNNRVEHLQVRVMRDGLWSSWSSARVTVAFTQPAAAVATISVTADAELLVSIVNPAPTGTQPAVAYHAVYVDDGDGRGLTRRERALAPGATWTYWRPISGRVYAGQILVRTYGTNGATADTIAA